MRACGGFSCPGCPQLAPPPLLPLFSICATLPTPPLSPSPPSAGHRCGVWWLAWPGPPSVGWLLASPTHPPQHRWLVAWASLGGAISCGAPWPIPNSERPRPSSQGSEIPRSITMQRVAWASFFGVTEETPPIISPPASGLGLPVWGDCGPGTVSLSDIIKLLSFIGKPGAVSLLWSTPSRTFIAIMPNKWSETTKRPLNELYFMAKAHRRLNEKPTWSSLSHFTYQCV